MITACGAALSFTQQCPMIWVKDTILGSTQLCKFCWRWQDWCVFQYVGDAKKNKYQAVKQNSPSATQERPSHWLPAGNLIPRNVEDLSLSLAWKTCWGSIQHLCNLPRFVVSTSFNPSEILWKSYGNPWLNHRPKSLQMFHLFTSWNHKPHIPQSLPIRKAMCRDHPSSQ